MVQVNSLHPYRSFVIGHVRAGTLVSTIVPAIIGDVSNLLDLDGNHNLTEHDTKPQFSSRGLDLGLIHYSLSKTPSWADDDQIVDVENHLFLVARKGRFVCLYASESKLKSYLSRFVFAPELSALNSLETIDEEALNAAFVAGQTRTLWLSGIHRRTTVKADNKILAGINLRDALDPLDDQSFHFTSARSWQTLGQTPTTIGVTPRKSSLWIGLSQNWAEVCTSIHAIIDTLSSGLPPVASPFAILASTVKTTSQVERPFDISIIPPELGADNPTMHAQDREFLERWGYQACFEVEPDANHGMHVVPYLNAEKLGELSIEMLLDDPEKVELKVEIEDVMAGSSTLMDEVASCFRRVRWVKIWFESGHTLCNGAIFDMKHRDVPFDRFEWIDFGPYDISKEKPGVLANIGNSDSLFCWVKNFWPNMDASGAHSGAWLACDDGAGEIADFIFFDPGQPLLSLIHVKGAHSSGPNREVSVADYQVVTAQAIKNLRFLDRDILERGLRRGIGKQVSHLVWHNRALADRQAMINAIIAAGANCRREVVILQPRHSKALDDRARSQPNGQEMARLRQLDTLLIGAENDCHALRAPMRVLCEA